MRIFLIAVLLVAGTVCRAQSPYGAMIPTTAPLGFTPSQVFNITDYGAKCDGVTNDNTAINAAFAAAATVNAANTKVSIVGPSSGAARGCVVNSLNGTVFTAGTGANTRPQVEISEMTLLCTGAGNVCLDLIGASLVKVHDVSIRGDTGANAPEICIQVGYVNATSAAWNSFQRVNCNSEFSFTALYNAGSESDTYLDSMFVNNHTSSGPISTLGAITGGSGCTTGTYTGTALTGGSGSGALATIVVSGGAVTGVTVTYQGRDYAPSDTLSATVASCSGFSVPVSTIGVYAVVWDGQDHWRASSAFKTVTQTPDAWASLTLNSFINSHARLTGAGTAAMWAAWTGGLHLYHAYVLNSSGTSCVALFDNGVTKSGIPGPNWGADLDFNCEGSSLSYEFNLTGANATQTLVDFRYRGYHQGATAMFGTDANITSVSMQNADIDLKFATQGGATVPMFSSAKIWNVSAQGIFAPSLANWNAPATFNGALHLAGSTAPFGPVDLLPGAAFAYSCARQLSQSYVGPLCRVQRASDSTQIDLYPSATGSLDATAFTAFCNGTTCAIATMYDQSGNANNATQSTAASQPALSLQVAALGNRAAALWTDQGAQALSVTAASTINDLFASGGYVSIVADQVTVANQADRLLYKSNGGTIGFDWHCGFVGTSTIFSENASTTSGSWQTGSLNTAGRVMDVQYSSASVSNNAIVGFQGTAQSLTTTSPVGTIASDSAQNMLIGNSAATSGTRGFPGYIAEVVSWKVNPTAAQLEMIRRNQGAYYGMGSTVN